MTRAGVAVAHDDDDVPQEVQEKTEIFPVPFCTTSLNFKAKTVDVPAVVDNIDVAVLVPNVLGERAVAVGGVVSPPIVKSLALKARDSGKCPP
jgi:hypothetical protein